MAREIAKFGPQIGDSLTGSDRLRVAVMVQAGKHIAELKNKGNKKWEQEVTARADTLAEHRPLYCKTMHPTQGNYRGRQNGALVPEPLKRLWDMSRGATASNIIWCNTQGVAIGFGEEAQTFFLNTSVRTQSDQPTLEALLGASVFMQKGQINKKNLDIIKSHGLTLVFDMHSFKGDCLSTGAAGEDSEYACRSHAIY
jgi:hypothetical protein